MKHSFIYTFLALASFSFLACEKDDICTQDDPTTPGIVLEFYDINNPTEAKIAPGLLAYVQGSNLAIQAEGNKIILPLQVGQTQTTWQVTLNAQDQDVTNDITDEIILNYAVNHQYVSKACGYRAVFNLEEANPVSNTNNWITNLTLQNSIISSQNETHIKIYF